MLEGSPYTASHSVVNETALGCQVQNFRSKQYKPGRCLLAHGYSEGVDLVSGSVECVFLHSILRGSLLLHLRCFVLASFPGRLSPCITRDDHWQLWT